MTDRQPDQKTYVSLPSGNLGGLSRAELEEVGAALFDRIESDRIGRTLQCWSGFCIATDCDGTHHVDATGRTWTQQRGQEYDPEVDAYVWPFTDEL